MPKIVLSLCGGGVRGTFTARFLKHLDNELIRQTGKGIYEHVDLYAGTSIGSVIAASFSYQKHSGEYIDSMFSRENSKMIMNKNWMDYIFGFFQSKPMYDGKGKRKFINQEFSNVGMNDSYKLALFTGYDVASRESIVFKSWEPCNETLRDVLDLSSAAPSYFPSVKTSTGLIGIDGGIFANNPCIIAYSNAIKRFGEDADIRVVSIGTGIQHFTELELANRSLSWGAIPWATKGSIIDRMLDAPEDEVHKTMNTLTCSLGHDYYRVNPLFNKISLDDTSEEYINYLKTEADRSWKYHGKGIVKMILDY